MLTRSLCTLVLSKYLYQSNAIDTKDQWRLLGTNTQTKPTYIGRPCVEASFVSVAFAWYKYSVKTNVHRQTLRRSFLCISGVSSSAIPTNDLSVIYNNLFFFSNKIGYFDVADSHNSPLRTNLVNHVLGHVYMFILS